MKSEHIYSSIAHFALAIVLVFAAAALQADRDAERSALSRLAIEIERLEPLIERAKNESEPNARVRFRYDWLRRDLNEVKTGIDAYLTDAEFTPRTFDSLQGEYHQ